MHDVVVLAHQGGWDEILMVAGPVALFVGMLRVARQRAETLAEEQSAQELAEEQSAQELAEEQSAQDDAGAQSAGGDQA